MSSIPNKLKSRKLWIAISGEVTGIVALIFGVETGEIASIITGGVISILAILGYLKAESDIDKARAANSNNKNNTSGE